jgi:hypothetical protein
MRDEFISRRFGNVPVVVVDALYDSTCEREAEAFQSQTTTLMALILVVGREPLQPKHFRYVKSSLDKLKFQQKIVFYASLISLIPALAFLGVGASGVAAVGGFGAAVARAPGAMGQLVTGGATLLGSVVGIIQGRHLMNRYGLQSGTRPTMDASTIQPDHQMQIVKPKGFVNLHKINVLWPHKKILY